MNNKQHNTLFLLNVFLPLLFGGGIYIAFREGSLLMFSWFNKIGLTLIVNFVRIYSLSIIQLLPDWFTYSLPDGLWLYSIVSFFSLIWENEISVFRYFWLSIGPIIAIGSEIGQLFGFVNGTYSNLDLLSYILATYFALYITNKKERVNYEIKKTFT